jgi:hypothetical protein
MLKVEAVIKNKTKNKHKIKNLGKKLLDACSVGLSLYAPVVAR